MNSASILPRIFHSILVYCIAFLFVGDKFPSNYPGFIAYTLPYSGLGACCLSHSAFVVADIIAADGYRNYSQHVAGGQGSPREK